MDRFRLFFRSREGMIAAVSMIAIAASLILGAIGMPRLVTILPLG